MGALDSYQKALEINPDYDALSVIQKTKASISMPFSSTAVLAKEEGRPSVYYDPTDIIQKDDRAAHGIPILNGIGELKVWIKSIKKSSLFIWTEINTTHTSINITIKKNMDEEE